MHKMNKNNKKYFWIAGFVVMAFLLYQYSPLGTIFLSSSQIQYNNAPIEVRFTTANFTNPTVTTLFNNIALEEYIGGNETIKYTKSYINGTYTVRVEGINNTGILTIALNEGNLSESESVEVKNPYVRFEDNIPTIVDVGSQTQLKITTLTPQGSALEADEVSLDVYDPSNQMTTLVLDKSGNVFTKNFNYATQGNYIFKVHARKQGFETQERTIITNVTKTEGVHPIVWVWVGFIILYIILVIIKKVRSRGH